MLVLGIDLSLTSTGLALVSQVNPELERGPQTFNFWTIRPKTTGVERLVEITGQILEITALSEPHLVAIEGYSFGSRGSAIFQIGELGGVVRYALHHRGYKFVEIPPGQWRKQLFSRGNLPKDEVRVEAYKRYGVEFASLDVLEAWCVGTAALRSALGIEQPAPMRRRKLPDSVA